ncbi:MAG: hypothetical protein ACXAEU_22745 [Candidatus Hodarchaeales archaeon]
MEAYGAGYEENSIQTAIILLETASIIKNEKKGRYIYLEIIKHVPELEIDRLQQDPNIYDFIRDIQ